MLESSKRCFRLHFGRAFVAAALIVGCSDILAISPPNARPLASAGEAGENGSMVPSDPASGAAGAESAESSGDAGAGASGFGGSAHTGGVHDAGAGGDDSGGHGGTGGTSGSGGALGGASGTGGGAAGSGGASGVPGTVQPVCATGQNRCDPGSPKTPQVCSAAGQWIRNTAEGNGSDCTVACSATTGLCVECQGTEQGCKDNYPSTCLNGAWSHSSQACSNFCSKGECQYPSSCGGTLPTCGPGSADSCCLSFEVTGGDFNRINNATYKATVSTFTMDKYEVAASRFAKYAAWLYGPLGAPPVPGSGKASHNAFDTGWQSAYPLPTTQQAMSAQLACDPAATFGTNSTLPANCVDFYEAYAFCIWDGGRLPTEAEWNYAAAGGAQQRIFPWSNPPNNTVIDSTDAAYVERGNQLKAVGTFVNGYGRYGQADLSGNVAEWTLDYYSTNFPTPCVDCINMAVDSAHEVRGGAYVSINATLKTTSRSTQDSDQSRATVGFRCVHDL